MKVGYKLLKRDRKGKLISCRAIPPRWVQTLIGWHSTGNVGIIYDENYFSKAPEKAVEKGYHLLVFNTLHDVREFQRTFSAFLDSEEVWRVVYRGVIVNPPPLGMENIMGGETYASMFAVDRDWPKGTIMAREVMLIEKEDKV